MNQGYNEEAAELVKKLKAHYKNKKDKFKIECRFLGITLFELKFDISRRCFKLVVLNFGFGTMNCEC